jgi:hypothetical protein
MKFQNNHYETLLLGHYIRIKRKMIYPYLILICLLSRVKRKPPNRRSGVGWGEWSRAFGERRRANLDCRPVTNSSSSALVALYQWRLQRVFRDRTRANAVCGNVHHVGQRHVPSEFDPATWQAIRQSRNRMAALNFTFAGSKTAESLCALRSVV